VVRNKLAEICEKYLSKGDKVYVEGKLKNRQWEQDGVKRYSTEIQVNEMTMLTTKKNLEKTNTPPQDQASSVTAPKSVAPEEKEDLPF